MLAMQIRAPLDALSLIGHALEHDAVARQHRRDAGAPKPSLSAAVNPAIVEPADIRRCMVMEHTFRRVQDIALISRRKVASMYSKFRWRVYKSHTRRIDRVRVTWSF